VIFLKKEKYLLKVNLLKQDVNELCNFIDDLPSDTVCLLPCYMCDVLNTAMLSRIASEEILLITEDEIECIPYMKKRILKVLTDNDDDNTRTAGLSKQISIKVETKVIRYAILLV